MNRPILRATQTGSRIITVVTVGALMWAVNQAGGRRHVRAA